MLEERAILVSFLLSIKEEASSPKLLWFISALARTVFTWLPVAQNVSKTVLEMQKLKMFPKLS